MADRAPVLAALSADGAGPLLILLALGVLAGVAAMWLVVRARKPPRRPVLTDVVDTRAQAGGVWRTLRDRIAQAAHALRYLSERREWRYAVPWILVCGEVGSGKTSALASITTGRRVRLTAAEEKLPIAGTGWHFHDRGLSIDVDSDASFAADDTAAHRRWRELLRHLVDYRPERALDGLVLTISARTLLTGSAADAQRLATRCHALLWDVQERFEFALPVYVIVTQCDTVPGFGAFWKAQPDQRLREMFGWSNPYSVESTFVPEWLDEAFDEMGRALKRLQLQAAAGDRDIGQADEFFLFPQRFRELTPRLRAVLAQVFRASAYHANSFFRGVYFTGSVAAEGASLPAPRTDVAFIDRLFEEKIYAEPNLARPIRQALWSRHRLIRRLQIGAAGAFALLCLALAHAGVRLHSQVGAGIASLDLIEHPQRLSHAAGGCIDKETVYDLLANISSLDVSLTFAAIPASWVDRHISEREIQLVADKAFEEVIFPSLACHLEQHARRLLAEPMGRAQSDEAPIEERDNLRDYIDRVATFERNLAYFNRLVMYASSDQADELLDRFDQLAQYVYGDPLPAAVHQRRGQHREALAHVEYRRPLELPLDLRASIGRRIEAQTDQVRREIDRQIDAGATLLDALNREQAPILANTQRFDRWLERMRQEWLAANEQNNPCRTVAQWLEPALHDLRRQYG
ncbi:MAG: type VI secretion system protein, partial [Sulfurifustaceae bacterium]